MGTRRTDRPAARALRRLAVACVAAGAAACSSPAGPGSAPGRAGSAVSRPQPPVYYLSLGDSLAAGYQPTAAHPGGEVTASGYADDLFRQARAEWPTLQLAKLGCPGETTETMMRGGDCPYPAGSQLAAATQFLRAHGRSVVFVTVDIGANDVDTCVLGGTVDAACVSRGIASITGNLGSILAQLRQAAPGVPILTMNLYDPYLVGYLYGTAGSALAAASLPWLRMVNDTIATVARRYSVPTADVADAFDSYDTSSRTALPGHGDVPTATARICQLTWMCSPAPSAPNIHPDDAGYRTIAAAFRPLLPSPVSGRRTGRTAP